MERNQSLSQAQIQELIDNPPTKGMGDGAEERFRARDWQSICVGELCEEGDLRWVELDTGVEDATNVRNCSVHKDWTSY
jgi:hypothetical protein